MLRNLVASLLCALSHCLNALRGTYRSRALPCAKPKRTILRLEDLEGRICMDTDLWVAAAAGNWSVGANWSSGHAPAAGDIVQFGGSTTVGGKVVTGTNSASTDDIADPSIAQLNIKMIYGNTITLNNSLTVTNSVSIDNGTLSTMTIAGAVNHLKLPNTGETFNWGGGTIGVIVDLGQRLGGTIQGGTMTIAGTDVTLTGTLNNYGTVNWQSQNPQVGPGPNINLTGTITNAGTFNILTKSTEQIIAAGGATFSNSGLLVKSAPSTTSFGSTLITDAGNININGGGTLSVNNILFTGTGGAVTLSGSTLITVGILALNNKGSISGVGTIQGSVNNTTGTVTPGLNGVPGTLTIQGNYTQAANGTLVINIDSVGNFGQLVVQPRGSAPGAVTLDGTLTVNRNPDFTPPQGYDIPFLTYLAGQLTGTFATLNCPNSIWVDPINGEWDTFFDLPNSKTTYDLVVIPD